MKHTEKRKLGIIATLSTFAVFGLTATLIVTSGNVNPFNVAGEDSSDYYVTLDNSNAWTSGTTKDVTTSSGAWSITFEYSGASVYDGGHVTLAENGTLINKTLVKSVDYLQVDWNSSGSGKLQAKTSFDGETWGSLWDVTDDYSYSLPSNPYFISFVATGGSVNISSVRYQYSCIDNPKAQGTVTGSAYKLVKSKSEISSGDTVYIVGKQYYNSTWYGPTSLGTNIPNASRPWYPGGTSVTITDETIESGGTEWVVTTSGTNYIFTSGGSDLYSYTNGTNYSINIGTSYTVNGTTTNVVDTYGAVNTWTWDILDATTGNSKIMSTSVDVILSATPSYTPITWRGNTTAKWGSEETYPIYLYKKVEVREYDKPKDCIGFTATDSNANSYETSSVYSTDNSLSVTAIYSDGTSAAVASTEYTYKVSTDAAGSNVIDHTAAFATSGIYYVTVNYGTFMPSKIQLNVAATVTGISAEMATKTYTTADTVIYTNNLTATLSYDSGSTVTKTYAEFIEAGITVTLLTPAGVEYSASTPFGTAGTWTVRVSYLTFSSDVAVTVNAVPVQSISLDQTSYTLVVDGTVQLVASINPTTATNKNVSWSTSDSTVATVDAGLVTGVNVGKANITATSEDGSYTATCAITVNAKPVVTNPELVTDASTLAVDDKFYIGEYSNSAIAGDISGKVMSKIDGTFDTSADPTTITDGYDSACELTLGGSAGAWTFANSSGQLLGATAARKLAWDSGTTTWTISIASNGDATITSTNSAYGKFLYNVTSPRFTTYTSEASTSMLVPQIYKSGTATPIYPTAISFTSASKDIAIGDAEDFSAMLQFTPSDANQKTVTWSSSNSTIAAVSTKGLVTGLKAGTTTITATGKDESGNNLVASCAVTVKSIAVTGVSLSQSTAEISIGKTKVITASVSPSNATNKSVTWSSSNTSVASVSEGTITANAVGNATITATTSDGGYTATCAVTVTETPIDDWTVLIYMCGSDLESKYTSGNQGLATGDLKEIASVSGQPDGVNIVVEAGGASAWSSTYSSVISASYLNRFHLSNKSYVKDEQITNANMGLQSTFQSFLEWGISTYPADKYGVIFWNHGGGMYGACYDENYDSDSLSNSEMNAAFKGARSSLGITSKFEFVGYDCCLMQVQDIAEFNSNYFNYMVASEESESGYGWDYDTWVDDLFNLSPTTTVLKAIVDGFITDQGGTSSSSNQTLSYLTLSYAAAYKTAWENMAQQLTNNLTSSNKSDFCSLVNKCKYFADEDYTYYCLYDAKDFINKLAANSSLAPGSTYTNAVLTAFNNLVTYSVAQKGAGNAYGLCMAFCANEEYAGTGYFSHSTVYGSNSQTNFTIWRALQKKIGYLAQ